MSVLHLLWELTGELVEQEFATSLFEVLLTHTLSSFESSVNEGRWS
jgi:hypothetical protein